MQLECLVYLVGAAMLLAPVTNSMSNSPINRQPRDTYKISNEVNCNEHKRRIDVPSSSSSSSSSSGDSHIEKHQEDFDEAEDFGISAMNKFYEIQEPKLFELGLVLDVNHPARYVAAFNRQTDEAKDLAKVAYAALRGSTKLIKKYGNTSREISPNDFERDKCAWTHRRAGLRERCPRRGAPHCSSASSKYRTADGSCNNFDHPWWGSAMSTMQRFIDPVYADGIEAIRRSVKNGRPLPSPRNVTTSIHEERDVPLASVTHMLMQWGQFIDHDLTATAQSRGFNGSFPQCCRGQGTDFQPPELMHPDCLPIAVDARDKFFGRLGVRCLEFVRSGPAPREDCGFGPREQLSQVTSYLDGSMIYSSNALHSDSLRIFRNGLLQYGKLESRKPLLPKGEPDDLCRRGALSTNCFRAGDARLSEQPALTSLHIVFLRLHNRMAIELAALNPHWNDEKLYQETRKINGAILQHITYREFLPIVLGPEVMKIFDIQLQQTDYYKGYDSTVNPNVGNSFSAAAYRFGHSLVQRGFARYNAQHNLLFNNVTIHGEFDNKLDLHSPGSVDRLLLGLVNQPSQRRDEFITSELTNHLFQFPNFPFGMDLASINIQRGRDHGLAPYVKWREPCGLSPIRTWRDFERATSTAVSHKFRRVYEALEDIDLFTAGLAEKPVLGGLVGPTFACIIAQQFSNSRKGDRFWYENGNLPNSFTPQQLEQIRHVTFAQILCKTMDNIETIQPFVFLTPDTMRNERVDCNDPKLGHLNLNSWTEKRKSVESIPLPSIPVRAVDDILIMKNDQPKMFPWQKPKPIKTNVNQKNRIVVKRPLGSSQDNVTIVVQNHAINAPIFVNDALYGTNWQTLLTGMTTTTSPPKITTEENVEIHVPTGATSQINYPTRPFHIYDTDLKPYVPMKLTDPNNPNNPYLGNYPASTPPLPLLYYPKPSVTDTWINLGPIQQNDNSNWYEIPVQSAVPTGYELRANTGPTAVKSGDKTSDINLHEVPQPIFAVKNNGVYKKEKISVSVKTDESKEKIRDKVPTLVEIPMIFTDDRAKADEIPRPMILRNKG